MLKENKALYFRLLHYVRPYWLYFAIGLIATIVMASTQPAIAALMQPLLDGAFVEKDPFYITWMPIALVALFIVRGLTTYITTMAFAWISAKMVFDLRLDMFRRIIGLPTRYYDHHPSGKVISKVTYDVTQVTSSATDVLITLVRDSIQVLGLVFWLLYLDWKLSLLLFGMIPVTAAIVIFAGKRLRVLSRKLQKAFGELTHILGESIKAHKEIKMFGGQKQEMKNFAYHANWVRRYQMKFRSVASISVPVVEIYGAIMMALIIYFATHRTAEETLTVGTFMSFFVALGLLFAPIKRLTKVNEPLQKGLAAAESVFSLIDEKPEKEYTDESKKASKKPLNIEKEASEKQTTPSSIYGNIQFNQITFQYLETDKPAVEQFNLTVSAHQTVALVGASGSGKSTVAQLLPRLYDWDQGEILLDGKNLRDFSLAELRQQMALVSQDVVLFNRNIAENIAYGTTIDKARIQAVADAANVTEFVQHLSDGFDTLIGDNGVRLSGGQRQRLAIARALYKDAPILILDEATSALDNESERLVQEAIDRLRENRTTLVIAHRLSTIENADHIVVMEQGKIVEQGNHHGLLAQNGYYARLYQHQFTA